MGMTCEKCAALSPDELKLQCDLSAGHESEHWFDYEDGSGRGCPPQQ